LESVSSLSLIVVSLAALPASFFLSVRFSSVLQSVLLFPFGLFLYFTSFLWCIIRLPAVDSVDGTKCSAIHFNGRRRPPVIPTATTHVPYSPQVPSLESQFHKLDFPFPMTPDRSIRGFRDSAATLHSFIFMNLRN